MAKKQKYRWAEGTRVKSKAQAVGERLTALTKKAGQITPEMVVEDARRKDAPYHDDFEWEDTKAAELYRLEQARYLLRHIEITRNDEGKAPIRGFLNIVLTSAEEGEEKDQVYATIGYVMSKPELRRQVLARAWKELQAWVVRYKELKEFGRVRKAVASVQGNVERNLRHAVQ